MPFLWVWISSSFLCFLCCVLCSVINVFRSLLLFYESPFDISVSLLHISHSKLVACEWVVCKFCIYKALNKNLCKDIYWFVYLKMSWFIHILSKSFTLSQEVIREEILKSNMFLRSTSPIGRSIWIVRVLIPTIFGVFNLYMPG